MIEGSIPQLMDRIPQYFVPEKAAGVDAVVQFSLTGEGGGDWIVTIRDQKCSVIQGVDPNPRLVFSAEAQDCLDILSGKMDGMRAYMRGRLRLKGDMSLAIRLAGFFKLDQ
jgi:putative sterol carrier protein